MIYLQNLISFEEERSDCITTPSTTTSVLSFLHFDIFIIVQMSALNLNIRIPKESLIKLNELQEKELVIKFNGGREVSGKLKSWDRSMNLILEGTQ